MKKDLMKMVIDFLMAKEWFRVHHHMSSISHWNFSKSEKSVVIYYSDGRREIVPMSEVLKSEVA